MWRILDVRDITIYLFITTCNSPCSIEIYNKGELIVKDFFKTDGLQMYLSGNFQALLRS